METVERTARRYYLRGDRGESSTARLPAECDVTMLPPRAGAGRGGAGPLSASSAAGPLGVTSVAARPAGRSRNGRRQSGGRES